MRSRVQTGRAVRVVLLLSAGAVLLVALRLLAPHGVPEAGESPPSRPSGSPPVPQAVSARLIDGGYRCPADAPVAAYGTTFGHHYFQPRHPRQPSTSVEPDGCFATDVLAQAAGYTKGLPPPGWQEFDGWYLAPDEDLGVDSYRMCFVPARRLDFAVACPHLLPPPGDEYGLPRCGTALLLNPGCIYRPDPANPEVAAFYLQYEPFLDASGGLVWRHGLMVAAFRADHARPGSDFESLFLCGGAKPVDRVSLVFPWSYQPNASGGRFVECGDGLPPSAGQTLLWWRIGDQTFVLGMPGDLDATRNVLLDLAASVEIIQPTR
jgi:hypothetical protein